MNLSAIYSLGLELPNEPFLRQCLCRLLFKMSANIKLFSPTGRLSWNSRQQPHPMPENPKGGVKWRKRLLILWVLGGFIVSCWIFWHMNGSNVSRRKETLANMCDERARMLQDQFNVSMNHVHALAILVSTFHHGKEISAIDQKTFAEYTERTSFERPLTSGVAYAVKVLHSEREEFEKQHGWTIKRMGNEDQSRVQDDYIPEKLDPSPEQDEYAPVIFCQDTMSHIVSIDMMSGEEDRENIMRAGASGKGVLTSPFKLLKSNHLGVVLTFAVYKTNLPPDATPEERTKAALGYLGAAFDVPSLVEKLLQQLASKQTIVVNVYDITDSSSPIKMYGPNTTDTGLYHISHLDFGDPHRRHEMRCRFKQKPPFPWSAIMMSSGVLVIVLLVGHILHAAVNRIAKVEDDYLAMKELKVRAEAADVAKSQFLATVSHEIRTPMNGVLGMLQMLMDTDLDATQQDFAKTAQASGRTLIALINEVLDQAKIESGRLELEAVPFDFRAVLDIVVSLFAETSQEKGIELAVYVSDQVPEILIGDPGRFRQIITNLVGNSIKFTAEGHVFVSVHLSDELKCSPASNRETSKQQLVSARNEGLDSCETLSGFRTVDRRKSWENFKSMNVPVEANGSTILLVTVEDTGVGIPKDAQSRIFMPFMQADSSTSRTYGGTGIGLSISKCLVDLMGGEIGFASESRIGSTFTFTATFSQGPPNLQDMKLQTSDSVSLEFRGMRAVIIDERSTHAEVTKYHFARLGIQVVLVNDLKSAFSCICSGKEHVDMLLVDKESWVKGPVISFASLVRKLRQDARSNSPTISDVPKMFLIATSTSPSELEDAKSCGFADTVIMKPLRASMIAACLQQAFGTRSKSHQEKKPPAQSLKSLLSGKQILVVDDNVVNRRVAAGALKKYGASVTCVESGKLALVMLQPPHKFDACFMDVQMPEMDGFQATEQIRRAENLVNEQIKSDSTEAYGGICHWHVPILAMTADVIQATHEKCVKSGMDGYISKPFEEEQLYSTVARFFES